MTYILIGLAVFLVGGLVAMKSIMRSIMPDPKTLPPCCRKHMIPGLLGGYYMLYHDCEREQK